MSDTHLWASALRPGVSVGGNDVVCKRVGGVVLSWGEQGPLPKLVCLKRSPGIPSRRCTLSRVVPFLLSGSAIHGKMLYVPALYVLLSEQEPREGGASAVARRGTLAPDAARCAQFQLL